MRSTGSNSLKTFACLTVFAVAMGFLEAIVVVYLRQIYYPGGFEFPLTMLSPEMISVEWIREFATLIMLASVGILAGKNILQRLLYFLYGFAIWDIFYYVALKLFLDWPPSIMTWDLLFLIPVSWIGPVLAPVICSLTMILMAAVLIPLQERRASFRTLFYEWLLVFLGAFIILCTFIKDYSGLLIRNGFLAGKRTPADEENLRQAIAQYIPTDYNWILFIAGEIIILAAVTLMIKRNTKK
ncbi:MAG TPA: hypothetical protein VMV74_11985 [Bacteroidales bacterium]|nr:hypothetical protein [Bacteroidales bacterium]